ncbi:transcriptional regulator [Agrobacterium tumefaciens]|nr:transcriptional regulator [Agrobacterium tumefaciens]
MAENATVQVPPRYLRTPEAARFLGLSGRTLEKHRTYGTGPTFRKLGGRVVYAVADLQAWANRGSKISTADSDAILPAKRHDLIDATRGHAPQR